MATRIITINSCNECPNQETGGGFGKVMYVPFCGHPSGKGRKLPYTEMVGCFAGRTTASCTGEIPSWCPLAKKEG